MKATKRRRPVVEALEGRALLTAGTLDTTFGGIGTVTTQVSTYQNTASNFATGVAIQSDLKTVEVGPDRVYPSGSRSYQTAIAVLRYNPDGSPDASFGSGGRVVIQANSSAFLSVAHPYSVRIQADGKIVVAGDTLVTYGKGSNAVTRADLMVVRLNANGSLDTTFGAGGKASFDLPTVGNVQSCGLAIQPDGKIVEGGNGRPGNWSFTVVARWNTNGTLDATFGGGVGYVVPKVGPAFTLALDPLGNILLGGTGNPTTTAQVVRLTATGALDNSFGSGGVVLVGPATNDGVTGLGLTSSGEIVAGGEFSVPGTSSNTGVALLTNSGALDTTFGSGGFFSDPTLQRLYALTVQPDNKIVLAAEWNPGYRIDRVLATGQSLDPAFGSGGQTTLSFPGFEGYARPQQVVIGPDGKITASGWVNHFNGQIYIYDFAAARLLNDITSNVAVAAYGSPTPALGTPQPMFVPLSLDATDVFGNLRTKKRAHQP